MKDPIFYNIKDLLVKFAYVAGKFPASCSFYWWYLMLELGPTHQHHRTRADTNSAQRYSILKSLDAAMHGVRGGTLGSSNVQRNKLSFFQ